MALESASANEGSQAAVGSLAAGDDEQPRRVAVEPVNDAGPLPLVPARDAVTAQVLDERDARVACAGVDDDSGGFVDDQ